MIWGIRILQGLCILGGVLVLSMIGISLSGGRINRTASHPVGLYWIVAQEPQVGLYAQFCIPATVAELPPLDEVYTRPCTKDRTGNPMLKRITAINTVLDEYYVQGDHPKSLDSRIFGPLKRDQITALLVPVWVTGKS